MTLPGNRVDPIRAWAIAMVRSLPSTDIFLCQEADVSDVHGFISRAAIRGFAIQTSKKGAIFFQIIAVEVVPAIVNFWDGTFIVAYKGLTGDQIGFNRSLGSDDHESTPFKPG